MHAAAKELFIPPNIVKIVRSIFGSSSLSFFRFCLFRPCPIQIGRIKRLDRKAVGSNSNSPSLDFTLFQSSKKSSYIVKVSDLPCFEDDDDDDDLSFATSDLFRVQFKLGVVMSGEQLSLSQSVDQLFYNGNFIGCIIRPNHPSIQLGR